MTPKSLSQQILEIAFLPIVDFFALLLSALFVYYLRYRWLVESFDGTKNITGIDYFWISLGLCATVIFVYSLFGLYRLKSRHGFWQSILDIIFGTILVLLSLITFLFFNEYNRETLPKGVQVSRFIIGFVGIFAILSVFAFRVIYYYLLNLFFKAKVNILIVGGNAKFIKQIRSKKRVGLLKNVRDEEQALSLISKNLNKNTKESLKDVPIDGKILQKISSQFDEVYAFINSYQEVQRLAQICELKKIRFVFYPKFFDDFEVFNIGIFEMTGIHLFEILHTSLDGWNIILKRLFDIFLAIVAIILLSPIMLIVSILIFLESPGPVIYLSDRVGPNGKAFKMFKFRRLKLEFCTSETDPNAKKALEYEAKLIESQNLKQGDIQYKISADPRSTKIGRFIEKTSLDEISQLFNILIGNMSFVGPRPHQPRDVAKYQKRHLKVLNIKPGVTGMAQIKGRSDLSFEDEVKYDVYYLENWSFWLDIWIIIRTAWNVFFARHSS